MSVRPIIDAGPSLNFLSINKERLLIAVLGPFSAPETVQGEVLRKSQQDDRFRAAATVWRKLTTRWIQILPDDATPELATVVQRVSGLPMDERRRQPKDLSETMVIAHADSHEHAHRSRVPGLLAQGSDQAKSRGSHLFGLRTGITPAHHSGYRQEADRQAHRAGNTDLARAQ